METDTPVRKVWIRALWTHPRDSFISITDDRVEIPSNGSELVIGREYVATIGLDRDRPVESVSRRAVALTLNANDDILLQNTSANFIYLYKKGSSEPVTLEKDQKNVLLSPGDAFSLSGEFYRVAVEATGAPYVPVETTEQGLVKSSRGSMQKLPTSLVSSEHGSGLESSSSSASAGAQGSSNSIGKHQKTEAVIREKPARKERKSEEKTPTTTSQSEDRPIARPASTRHETIFLEYEPDSDEDEQATNSKKESTNLSEDSPSKVSRKRKEREDEKEEAQQGSAEAAEDEEIAPRRSKRQRRELFHLDSILDERDEDVVQEDEYGSSGKKTRGGKRTGSAKANKAEEKLKEILRGFSVANFSSSAKTAIFYHEECLNHVTPEDHLEQPGRLRVAIEAVKMIQEEFKRADSIVMEANSWLPLSLDVVARVHDRDYLEKMRSRAERMQPDDLPRHGTLMTQDFGSQFFGTQPGGNSQTDAPKDTFISFGSWNAALLAAGGVCKAVDFICSPTEQRKARNAFVAVRPPGHHAGPKGHARSNTQGFCILNNVAIGAKYALEKYGLQRVAIIDIDVHAGNGTVECVEKEPNILFISLHCEEAYPFDADHTPEMYNLGPNILNVGFKSNPTRRKFFKLFEEQAIPRLEEHKPELILISAGFDAHADDPTGVGALTSKDYIDITEKLKAVADKYANGRIVSVLEGGYNLDALKQSVLAHTCALMRSVQPETPGKGRKKAK